jgi:hypothetical protein
MSSHEGAPTERRRHPRFPFHRMASMLFDTGECSGSLLDASFDGALFEASSVLSEHLADCLVIIPFSRDPEEAIRLQAQTVYRRGPRLGLQWLRMDPESAMKLQRLVEMNLGTLKLLERPVLSLIWPAANQTAALEDRSASGVRPRP